MRSVEFNGLSGSPASARGLTVASQSPRPGVDAVVPVVPPVASIDHVNFRSPAGPGPASNISFELEQKRPLSDAERFDVLGAAAGALGTSPVPEPASLLFLGTGLLGLAHSVRRMRRDRTQPPANPTSHL